MLTTGTTRRAAIAAVVLLAAVAPSTAVAVSAVASAGVPDQHTVSTMVALPPPATVGQTAETSVSYDSTMSSPSASGDLSLQAVVSRQVTAVDAVGGYSTQAVVSSIVVSQAPSGFNTGQLDGLAGVSVQQSFTSTGAPASAAGSVASNTGPPTGGGEQTVVWIAATAIAFPAEPIAVGTSWSSPGQASVGGVPVPITYQCRLASVDDAQYVVELSYAADLVAPATSLGDVSGTIAGWGTVTGSRSNPLVVSGTLNQSIDGWARMDQLTSPLSITSTLTVVSA